MSNHTTSMIKTAADWWGEMMIPNPHKRIEFCRQLETSLREKEKTASDHEAVFVLGLGHQPHSLLTLALENAGLTNDDRYPVEPDDAMAMFLDFRQKNVTIQTGYRANLRCLYPG